MMRANLAVRMLCGVALGAAVAGGCFAAPPSPVTPLWGQVPTASAVPLGVNLEGMADWMRAPMFVDAIKTSRPFGQPDKPWVDSGNVPVDAHGWPLEDAGTCIITELPHMGGTYHFSCTGKADVTPEISKAHIANLRFDPVTNRTMADVIVDADATQLMLGFTNTHGGIKDARLIRPGYPADTRQVFTNEFLEAIRPFSTLRLMDYAQTNGSPVVHWGDRAKPSDAQYTRGKGGPWEAMIALANESGKDLWVNVPAQADDDYVRQMAMLFQRTLAPGRVVYLEYSNEVWNWSFPQATYNQQAAEREAAMPGSSLRVDTGVQWDDPNNKYYWGDKRVAERLIQISQIWQNVYGKAALNKTFRPVLASQVANPFLLKLQIGYIAKVYGPPSRFLYAVAGAPYFGLDAATINGASDSVGDVLASYDAAIDADTEKTIPPYVQIAAQYNVRCFAYEGGPDMGQTDQSLDAKVAANRDAQMQGLVVKYLNGWYGDGGDLFMYYTLTGTYNKWGCWGLTDDITQATPKTRAIMQVRSTPHPAAGRTASLP